jgi:hypothetical protein
VPVLIFDNFVKSLEIVMPDPVSGTGQARSGIQNVLNLLDSGLVVIPDSDPGRNDEKENLSTFYEAIIFESYKLTVLTYKSLYG